MPQQTVPGRQVTPRTFLQREKRQGPCPGDGLELGKELGARLVHLEEVQLHPTGFVDPKDPGAGDPVFPA